MKTSLVWEKGIKSVNEDCYLLGNNIWGVFDGANSLHKYVDSDGKTGGMIASMIAKESFEKNDQSLRKMAIRANTMIDNAMKKKEIDTTDKLNLWCTNLAVVRIVDNKLYWIAISDATIILVYANNSFKVISGNDKHDQETLVMWAELAKHKAKNIRKKLDVQIKKVRRQINISYGFLTGEKAMEEFLQEGVEDLAKIKHVILSTDGFIIPQNHPLDTYPWDEFVGRYLKEGINGLRDHIRIIERLDPNCWRYPRQKQHDDMTAISITF